LGSDNEEGGRIPHPWVELGLFNDWQIKSGGGGSPTCVANFGQLQAGGENSKEDKPKHWQKSGEEKKRSFPVQKRGTISVLGLAVRFAKTKGTQKKTKGPQRWGDQITEKKKWGKTISHRRKTSKSHPKGGKKIKKSCGRGSRVHQKKQARER